MLRVPEASRQRTTGHCADHASLRLSFATVGVDKIEEGARRLAQAL